MKATIVALLAAASLSAASYDIADILTASTAADTRAKDWKPGDGLALEVSGMDWTADGKLALTIRKGEVWLLGEIEFVTSTIFDIGVYLVVVGLVLDVLRSEPRFMALIAGR